MVVGDDGDVFLGVLVGFVLVVYCVVEVGYGFMERFDFGSWVVFMVVEVDVNGFGLGEVVFNVIFYFRGIFCWVC